MRAKTFPLALLGWTLAVGAAAHAAPSWTDLSCAPAGFRVLLPGKPRFFKKTSPMGSQELTIYNYATTNYPVAYLASYVQVPEAALQLMGPEAILKDFRTGFLHGSHGRVTSERTVSIHGIKAQELHVDGASGRQAVSRFGLSGNWLFHLAVTGPGESLETADAARFLGSLRTSGAGLSASRRLKAGGSAALKASPGSGTWTPFSLLKGGPSVKFPATPKPVKDRLKLASGPVEYHQFVVKAGSDLLAAGWADCAGAELVDPQALLAEHRDALAADVKGSLVTEKPIQSAGYPGSEFVIEREDGVNLLVRLFLVGNRVYQLTAAAPAAQSYSENAERFLASLKLPGKK